MFLSFQLALSLLETVQKGSFNFNGNIGLGFAVNDVYSSLKKWTTDCQTIGYNCYFEDVYELKIGLVRYNYCRIEKIYLFLEKEKKIVLKKLD